MEVRRQVIPEIDVDLAGIEWLNSRHMQIIVQLLHCVYIGISFSAADTRENR
jgi:hypothetical protein